MSEECGANARLMLQDVGRDPLHVLVYSPGEYVGGTGTGQHRMASKAPRWPVNGRADSSLACVKRTGVGDDRMRARAREVVVKGAVEGRDAVPCGAALRRGGLNPLCVRRSKAPTHSPIPNNNNRLTLAAGWATSPAHRQVPCHSSWAASCVQSSRRRP